MFTRRNKTLSLFSRRYFTLDPKDLASRDASELMKKGYRESWNIAPVLLVIPNHLEFSHYTMHGKPNINRKGKKDIKEDFAY